MRPESVYARLFDLDVVGLDHHSAPALRDAYTVGKFPQAEPAVRILVIEDEKKVARALREGLEAEHYEVRTAADGEEGFSLASRDSFDLVLLDLMLPQRDGIEVLTALRKRRVPTPVFILTAKDAIEDRVLGLDRDRKSTRLNSSHPSIS